MEFYNIHASFEILFIGFALSLILLYSLFLLIGNIEFISKYFKISFFLIKYIGIIYLMSFVVSSLFFFTIEGNYIHKERAYGPYAWAYWIMLLRPLILFSLTQIFWLKRFKTVKWYSFLVIISILLISVLSGQNFERFVIIATSLHRDYLPNNDFSYDNIIILFLISVIFKIVKSVAVFSSLVFVIWAFIGKEKVLNN